MPKSLNTGRTSESCRQSRCAQDAWHGLRCSQHKEAAAMLQQLSRVALVKLILEILVFALHWLWNVTMDN